MTSPPSHINAAPTVWIYLWLGLIGQFIWGSYPVFAKRAVAEVPKFSLLFFASVAATILGMVLLRRGNRIEWSQARRTVRQSRVLWLLAVFVVARSVSNIIAVELTRATWVQLIYILAPFGVAFLGTWFFSERTPPYTYRALILATLGSALLLVQDWSDLASGFTASDVLGLTIAVLSTLALATYYQLVRRSHVGNVSTGLIMVQQGIAMALTFLFLSWNTSEDWTAWRSVSTGGWLAALAVIFLVQVGGNWMQITALSGASPTLVTSMMPLRLISALILGWFILGEQLTSSSQWLGAVLVVGTMTIYLWLQRRAHSVTTT